MRFTATLASLIVAATAVSAQDLNFTLRYPYARDGQQASLSPREGAGNCSQRTNSTSDIAFVRSNIPINGTFPVLFTSGANGTVRVQADIAWGDNPRLGAQGSGTQTQIPHNALMEEATIDEQGNYCLQLDTNSLFDPNIAQGVANTSDYQLRDGLQGTLAFFVYTQSGAHAYCADIVLRTEQFSPDDANNWCKEAKSLKAEGGSNGAVDVGVSTGLALVAVAVAVGLLAV
ncbi:hypothetical protein JCM8097_003524 [Rhodosporidiobolus ruineniae]